MKFWKNLPYWARGGVLGLLIIIVLLSITAPSAIGPAEGEGPHFEALPLVVMSLPVFLPIILLTGAYLAEFGITFIILIDLIGYFLIGALLGWIYGKIKGRFSSKLTANS